MKKSALFWVRGRVQGVGFRYFCTRNASSLGLTGYVKNLYDGSVEVYAEGDEEKIRQFLSEIKQGPGFGNVEDVDEKWMDYKGTHKRFDIAF